MFIALLRVHGEKRLLWLDKGNKIAESNYSGNQTSSNNSTWYCLEYLYFRQIIWLFVEANRIESTQIINPIKNLNNNSKMGKFNLTFVRMLFIIRFDICFEVEYFNLKPSFLWLVYIRLRLQRFVIRLENKSRIGTRFADVWWESKYQTSPVLKWCNILMLAAKPETESYFQTFFGHHLD